MQDQSKLSCPLMHENVHLALATLKLSFLSAMAMLLAACGGGGGGGSTGGGSTASGTQTISGISATLSGKPGIIASSTAQSISIAGTNFVSGDTVTVTNGATNYAVSSMTVQTSQLMKANIIVPATSFPVDSYVSVTVQRTGGSSVSGILGVAHANKTLLADIQTIFNNNSCGNCHGTSGGMNISDYANSSSGSSTGLIDVSSVGCSQKMRVKPGDPRRANNVLIDVIMAKTTTAVMSCNLNTIRHMPPGLNPALSSLEIEAIVDWIALGAY